MESIPPLKRCSKCGVEKPLSEFTKHKLSPGGMRGYCKACAAIGRRAYYVRNAEQQREATRQYRQAHPDAIREYKREYHHRNRDTVNQDRRDQYQEQIQERRAKARDYRQRNLDNKRALGRRWRAQHPDRARQQSRESYYRNHDQRLAYARAYGPRWKAANRGAVLAMKHRRRARKAGNGGTHTAQQWRELKAHYNHRCLRCGRSEPDIKLTPDHVVPISLGGTSDIDNIQPLCRSCNCKKHAKTIDYR